MKWKTTLALLLVTAAVFAYLSIFERKNVGTAEAAREAQYVLNIGRDDITGLAIQNGDDKIDVRRQNDKWTLEAPIKDQADSAVVNSILTEIESWQKDATISAKEMEADKNRLNEFGLAKPKLRLKLNGPNAPPEILFGKDAALEGKMYVRFENSKQTFLASQSVRKAIEKKPEDFRDRKLTDLIMAQIVRVVLKTPAGEMELKKTGDHWDIVKPLRTRGDDQKIGDLISQVTTSRIEQFVVDDRGDLKPYGLAEPRGSITLFSQDDKQGKMLQIGGVSDKDKEQVYVRFSSRGFVYTLPKKIEEILNSKPNDLRDRHLVRIDTKILDRITLDAPGKAKTVLARKDENWSIASRNNPPANSSEVRRSIDAMQNEQVTKFVEDVASNLPKYGLDKPQLTVTFSSFASENRAESKAGEQPFASVAFGRIDGDNVYAHVGDEPFVVAVRRSLLDQILTDPLQWQDLTIFSFKPEQIHRLSVVTEKEIALVRGANNQWAWASGTGEINQSSVESILNTLATLHAVKWIGASAPAHIFDRPQLVISFTTSPDDKTQHKLVIGAATPDGAAFAKTDEHEGVFVVNNSDLNNFKLSLAGQPSPSPSASTSPTATP
jgi:uncharacterized protein DUF4340